MDREGMRRRWIKGSGRGSEEEIQGRVRWDGERLEAKENGKTGEDRCIKRK